MRQPEYGRTVFRRIAQLTAAATLLSSASPALAGDNTVPVALGRALRDAAPANTRWVEIAGGGHSHLYWDAPAIYQQTLRSFAAQLR